MKKERIKSVILCLLILNCIQLTGQIWLDKKLWPSGYNFFNSVANVPVLGNMAKMFNFNSGNLSGEVMYDVVVKPQKIVINSINGRDVYYDNEKAYGNLFDFTEGVIAALADTAPDPKEITEEQYRGFLKGSSLYVDFGFGVNGSELFRIYGIPGKVDFDQFSSTEAVILTADAETEKVMVCVKDGKQEEALAYTVDFPYENFTGFLGSFKIREQQDYAFAFELDLEKDIPRGITLDPFVLLPAKESTGGAITINNPLAENEAIAQLADKIVPAFHYTPSSLRKAVNNDGVVNYVENNATVTVYPSGLVEYQAVVANRGMKLGDKLTAKEAVTEILDISRNIWKAGGGSGAVDLRLQSDLLDNRDGSYKIQMNYYINGLPVQMGFNGNTRVESALYAEIEEGYLKTFKIVLLDISTSEQSLSWTSAVEAIGLISGMDKQIQEGAVVSDVYACYYITKKMNVIPKWCVKLEGQDTGIVLR